MEAILSTMHIHWICSALGVLPEQITGIEKNRLGLNNDTYILSIGDAAYFYRIPGFGTQLFCNRARERLSYQQVAPWRMTDEVLAYDPDSGCKLTVYYPGSHTVRTDQPEALRAAMDLLRRFHALPVTFGTIDSHFQRLARYERFAVDAGGQLSADFYAMKQKFVPLQKRIEAIPALVCPAHGDFIPDNVLIRPRGEPILLDLEFTAMGDPLEDLGTFCHHGNLRPEAVERLLRIYLRREPEPLERFKTLAFCATAGLMWYTWAAYKLTAGADRRTYQAFADRSLAYCAEMLQMANRL